MPVAFLFGAFLALLAFISAGSAAQSSTAPAPAPGAGAAVVKGRYLIVVETSKAMERRGVGALGGIRELLFTGMRGQLREGDSIGVWTFNDQLQTGKFPLQTWSAKNSRQIAIRALEFVRSQPFEKESRLQDVLAAMHGVVSNSAFITIALVTTGDEYISGTPFDAAINQTFKSWQNGQQKKQMPMVTMLRARKGQYTDFAVTPLPFPIDIPPFPADLQVVQAPKPLATNKPALAPLIVTGPKPQAADAVVSKLTSTTSTVPSLIFRGSDPKPTQNPVPLVTQPAPAANAGSISTPPATPPQEAAAVQPPKSTSITETNPAPTIQATQPETIAARPAEAPSPVASREAAPSTTPALKEQVTAEPSGLTNATGPAQTAVASPAAPLQTNRTARVVALAAAGLALAVLLGWLYLRRSPPSRRASLITQSLEREQK